MTASEPLTPKLSDTTMPKTTQANFIAKGDLAQLEVTITHLNQQKLILDSLSAAVEILSNNISRHHKFHRIRPMVKFICQRENDNDAETDRRRQAVAELDPCSRALCLFSLKAAQICGLQEGSFDALVSGLPGFIKAKPGRWDLIKRTIVDYVQDTVTEFKQDLSIIYQAPSFSTTGRRGDRPTKRLKMVPTRLDAGRSELLGMSNLAPLPSTTASMAESVLSDRRDQAHAEQANRTEISPQPKNLSSAPRQDSHMGSFESQCQTDGADCQPDWFTRGLTDDMLMVEMEDISQQPLDLLPPLSEAWWLGRVEAGALLGEVAFDDPQREQQAVFF